MRSRLWRDTRVLRLTLQLAFLGSVAALIWYLYANLMENLHRLGLATGFGWLGDTAGFIIAGSDFTTSESFLAAILIGVRNTALVSVLGIVLATVIGMLVGIARLSSNWLMAKAAAVYVETLRNVPVLVVIIFWWLVVMLQAPPVARAIELGNVVVLSVKGLTLPWFAVTGGLAVFLSCLGAGALAASAVAAWRTRRFARTGLPHHRVLWAGGVLIAAVLVAGIAGGWPLALSLPERGELETTHGLTLSPEYSALLIGLTLYSASHIAEIVRASILAVPRGQKEAAGALALSGSQQLRHVVLPQALRIMVPPLANQYLNLTKNSSLGVVVAFPEVTRIIRIAIGQQAPAPQAIAILMLVYLAFSLSTSLLTNLFHWRLRSRGAGR